MNRGVRNGIPFAAKKTDCDGWLKLVGAQAFMDLKKREQQSLMALCRDTCELQPLNALVIRMLGFPTYCERLLVWIRANAYQCSQLKIGELKQLYYLFLNDSLLTSLPKEIGNLKQLEGLKLDDNELTSLPKEIGDLKQLEWLHLGNNKLMSLPKEIWNLKQLRRLKSSITCGQTSRCAPTRRPSRSWQRSAQSTRFRTFARTYSGA
jgi:Leucine-rich repeat (LRR) protein